MTGSVDEQAVTLVERATGLARPVLSESRDLGLRAGSASSGRSGQTGSRPVTTYTTR